MFIKKDTKQAYFLENFYVSFEFFFEIYTSVMKTINLRLNYKLKTFFYNNKNICKNNL